MATRKRIEDNLLFKVWVGDHEYKIFTDGSISGFGDDPNTFIFNYFLVQIDKCTQEVIQNMASVETFPQSSCFC